MMKANKNLLAQIIIPGLLVGVLILTAVISQEKIYAESMHNLREKSEQLEQEIEQNKEAAQKKHKHAETLQGVVGELDHEISNATAQINATSDKITKLNNDLIKKQKELVRAKKLLKINMEALYKRGDASTVELLVGSDSFSQFIDEQEYLERIKSGIQDAAKKVIKLKKQIKAQRDEQKELLAKQKSAKESLGGMRAKKADLLAQTRGEEAGFRELVKEMEAKRAEVDKQITALIIAAQSSSRNYGVVSGNGQVIGRVGSTGFSTGPHLHFEMRNSSGGTMNPNGSMGAWPVSGYISQGYGCVAPYSWYYTKCGNSKSLHPGLDIVAPFGAPVVATKPGVIIFRGWDGAYGNKVVIKHNDGTFSVYGHLSSF